MKQADLAALSDTELRRLAKVTQQLADQAQRDAARYQREADRARKTIKRRGKDAG